jgi:enterochelin esterase-like enzyme
MSATDGRALRARRLCALAAIAAASLTVTVAPSSASALAAPPGWVLVGTGARQGTVWQGVVPRVGPAALYLPPPGASGRYPIVYVDGERPAAALATGIGLPDVADRLIWDGTTPPFATLVVDAPPSVIVGKVQPWASRALPLARRATLIGIGAARSRALRAALGAHGSFGTVALIGSPPSAAAERADALLVHREAALLRRHHVRLFLASARLGNRAAERRDRRFAASLSALALPHATATVAQDTGAPLAAVGFRLALPYALTSPHVQQASSTASEVIPHGWVQILSGPAGGTVWQGQIPNTVLSAAHRASLVYLPPHVDPSRSYPVVYLLHGLRGSPYSFIGGLRLAVIADRLIARGRIPAFVGVMPPAGRTIAFDGEWTGAWERYVIQDVLPWVHRHLPVGATVASASIAGFSAGAYGALDIGLRHPGLFGTLESLSGYFAAPHDGSLTGASASELATHDPTLLAQTSAVALRRNHVRVYLAAGRKERITLAQTRRYASLLTQLAIDHRLAPTAGGHVGRTWRAALSQALNYALTGRHRIRTSLPPAH